MHMERSLSKHHNRVQQIERADQGLGSPTIMQAKPVYVKTMVKRTPVIDRQVRPPSP